MVLSTSLATACATLTYLATLREPGFTVLVASLVRVFMNPVAWAVGWLWQCRRVVPSDRIFPPVSRESRSWLWGWGGFGALTVCTYYLAMDMAGIGLASVGASLSGIVTCLLGAIHRRRLRNRPLWMGVGLAVTGIGLLGHSSVGTVSFLGAGLSVICGVAGGAAYYCVARIAGVATSWQVMVYWTALGLVAHVGLLCITPLSWPNSLEVWWLLGGAGFCLAGSQLTAAASYRYGAIEPLSMLSYLTPILTCLVDWALFTHPYGPLKVTGIGMTFVATIFVLRTTPHSEKGVIESERTVDHGQAGMGSANLFQNPAAPVRGSVD